MSKMTMNEKRIREALSKAPAGFGPTAMRNINMAKTELARLMRSASDEPRVAELEAALVGLGPRPEYKDHTPDCCCDMCNPEEGI